MRDKQKRVFSSSKLSFNKNRVEAYARGEKIYPVTMEIDLTQKCTRSCKDCPYGASRRPGLTLTLPFIEKLFGILGPHVPGLVLSGGEPTSVPYFPEILAAARRSGFKEICVITNGSLLHEPKIQNALLTYATSVRVSLYDWHTEDSPYFTQTIKNISNLKQRAATEGSSLSVAASLLTNNSCTERLEHVGLAALSTGIDWLYFHPFCVDWDTNAPVQDQQGGVLEAIENLKSKNYFNGEIQVPYERYTRDLLKFTKLHAAHFLIQVGADGINYAGPECKYEQDYALIDLNEYMEKDFLWHPERLAKIDKINAANYRPIGTRHRPPIISAFIQSMLERDGAGTKAAAEYYHQPNVI